MKAQRLRIAPVKQPLGAPPEVLLPTPTSPTLVEKEPVQRVRDGLPPEAPLPPVEGLGVPHFPRSEWPDLKFTKAPPVKRPKLRRQVTRDPLLLQLDHLKVENYNLRMACIDLERQLLLALERVWRARNLPSFSMAVSRYSGAASFYGLRRLPITLYYSQWKYVFEHREEILEFIRTHEVLLSD